MKVVILAGGFGTRISEESHLKPKPMIEIGGQPILWHVMKEYSYYGFNEFIICAGYKQNVIKDYFANYYLRNSDVTFDFTGDKEPEILMNVAEPWKVTIVDTGLKAMTGGRIKRISKYLGDDEEFMLTYGDGVSSVDIKKLLEFHKSNNKLLTLTAIQPGERFGMLDIQDDGSVTEFREKLVDDGGWINGGYMVVNKKVLDYIEDDSTIFERDPLTKLSAEGKVAAFKHYGFWKCMDTLRDKEQLEGLIEKGEAPWMTWENKK